MYLAWRGKIACPQTDCEQCALGTEVTFSILKIPQKKHSREKKNNKKVSHCNGNMSSPWWRGDYRSILSIIIIKNGLQKRPWLISQIMGLFSTADTLTCHSRKSTGVTNNINKGSILFERPGKAAAVRQRAATHNGRTLKPNGFQSSLTLLFAPALLLLWHVGASSMVKALAARPNVV